MTMGPGSPSAPSLKYVTQGTYQRDIVLTESQTWTIGTEFEVTDLSDVIIASTVSKDELFSWVRGQIFCYKTGDGFLFEWMLIRQKTADSLPDLNDNAAVELLQKEKRIFARGLVHQPAPEYSKLSAVKFEVFNVGLRYGEELRFVVRPLTAASGTGFLKGLIEWRQVGI